jgi:hypothetical protein
MATLFKLNQITTAMERQEEKDRRNIFLMGSNAENALPNDS